MPQPRTKHKILHQQHLLLQQILCKMADVNKIDFFDSLVSYLYGSSTG